MAFKITVFLAIAFAVIGVIMGLWQTVSYISSGETSDVSTNLLGLPSWMVVYGFVSTQIGSYYILLMFIPRYFGYQVWLITNNSDRLGIMKTINTSTTIIDGKDPDGYFFGKWYIGYIGSSNFGSYTCESVWLYTNKECYDNLIKKARPSDNVQDIPDDKKTYEITTISVHGSFYNTRYTERSLTTYFTPTSEQKEVIEEIVDYYENSVHKNCVSFINGQPGTGKSMVGILLTARYLSFYTKNWNPTRPGCNFDDIYRQTNVNKSKPLVVVLEEVDMLLQNIHTGEIKKHRDIDVPIYNKSTWTSFWDDVDNGLYPYVIFIMTSNNNIDNINMMDSAYLRDGRVNKKFVMDYKISI